MTATTNGRMIFNQTRFNEQGRIIQMEKGQKFFLVHPSTWAGLKGATSHTSRLHDAQSYKLSDPMMGIQANGGACIVEIDEVMKNTCHVRVLVESAETNEYGMLLPIEEQINA